MATMEREGRMTREMGQGRSLLLILGVLAAIGAFVTLLTAPGQELLGESAYAVTSGMHGLMAGLLMVTVTIGLYQGYRLFSGRLEHVAELQIVTVVTSTLSLMAIIFGNWIYIGYREAGGPREFFVKNAPEVHKVFFEFKEFLALFTLPLVVAAAFIAYYYRQDLLERPRLRTLVAIVLALVFFYFMVAFGLGAAVTKLRPV